MGEHWDPWNQGASPGGHRWGQPPTPPPHDRGGAGGYVPGGFPQGDLGTQAPGPAAPPAPDDDLVGTPPLAWLLAALAVGLVAAGIALVLGGSILYATVAWALAGPVAIGLLAVFTQQDVRRRSLPIYAAPQWVSTLYWAVVAVAGVGVLTSAWHIAEWVGRR